MADLQWPPKRRVQEPMSLGKRVALVGLLGASLAPWIASAIYWYPRLNPELPFFERLVFAGGYWIFKLLAVFAIFVADRH